MKRVAVKARQKKEWRVIEERVEVILKPIAHAIRMIMPKGKVGRRRSGIGAPPPRAPAHPAADESRTSCGRGTKGEYD
jgi:hypothetical protein